MVVSLTPETPSFICLSYSFLTIATRKYGTATNPSPAPLLGSWITPPLCSSLPTETPFGQFSAVVLNPLVLSRTALKQQIGRCSVLQLMGTLMNTQTLSLHISLNASMMSSLGSGSSALHFHTH